MSQNGPLKKVAQKELFLKADLLESDQGLVYVGELVAGASTSSAHQTEITKEFRPQSLGV